jgi:DNA-binding IclR family transcriptional regulator
MFATNTETHMRSQNKVSRNGKSASIAATSTVDPKGHSPRALVIGLNILEYMAMCDGPMTQSKLAAALNISPSSIYRSILVLEHRGYLVRTGENGAYARTGKLCDIQSTGLPHQRLLEHAKPVMRSLCERISQSCNLAVPMSPDLKVVSQEESPGPFGINVPIGFRYDIPASAPGLAFAAFTKNSDPERWPDGLSDIIDAYQWKSLKKDVRKTAELGFAQVTNPYFPDVIDLSCPIFDNTQFIAALSIPYIKTSSSPNLTWCLAALQQASEELNELLYSDALVA